MIMTRQEFDDLICTMGTPHQRWDARIDLLVTYDDMRARTEDAEAARNVAQMKVEELRENFKKQDYEVRGLRANLSYESNLLRKALQESTDAALEAEAKAEKYYRKVRELEIALRLNCKMDPPTTKEIKEDFSQQPTTLLQEFAKAVKEKAAEDIDIIDEIGPIPETITWKQVMKLYDRAAGLREIVSGFENERVRLQSLLHSAVLQADATYEPYRKMVMEARAEVEKATKPDYWIPVEDRLPGYPCECLVVSSYRGDRRVLICEWNDGWRTVGWVTHWMRKPLPPEAPNETP